MAIFDRPPPEQPRRTQGPAENDIQPTNIPASNERLQRASRSPIKPWSGHAGTRSWLYSTGIHTLVLVAIAALWQPVLHGTNGQADRPIGIAVVHQQENGLEFDLHAGGSSGAANNSVEAALQTALNSSTGPEQANLDELLGPLAAVSNGVELSQGAVSGTGASGIQGSGAGGQATGNGSKVATSFLGVEGVGSSFVYVLDRSDSMNAYEGTPLQRAKRELGQSIQALGRVNQFQVIFYSDVPSPYRGSLTKTGNLIFATDVEKEEAARYVQGVQAYGSTSHFPALQMGLQLRPDVLFFLTDGDEPAMQGAELERVISMAQSAGTTIHAIQFGYGNRGPGGRWIENLAARSGGKYRYLDFSQDAAPTN